MSDTTSPTTRQFHPSIIREYDIRGVAHETLHPEDMEAIGRVFASMVSESVSRRPRIAVGRDGRLSSPVLCEALCRGLHLGGAEVTFIGIGPTPMLYFSVYHLAVDAGIMVTGSHNPKHHNGAKFMLGHAPFFGAQIRELAERASKGFWHADEGEEKDQFVQPDYVKSLLKHCRIPAARQPVKLVWDAGNGATGKVCEALVEKLAPLGYDSTTLFTDIDGSFPNHHPDPSLPENLQILAATVQTQRAGLGLAFDGDGDRLGAVDDKGRMISPDHLLMLLARAALQDSPGGRIIADVKTSQMMFDDVTAQGGQPLMWKTGHSHIKCKLKETNAVFAGEASGHVFFADRYYGFDDGLYAALRLIEYVASLDEPLSAVIDRMPVMQTTPELRIEVPEERKFIVIDEIRARLDAQQADYCAIDGVRMTTEDGWWLIRASNTQAAIIARAESADSQGLDRLIAILRDQLSASDVSTEALSAKAA